MPIYEYRCSSCGHELEALQKLSDALLTVCPQCSAPALTKLVSAAGFQLKGTGWYVTDFKGSGGKPAKTKDDASAAGKGDAKGEGTSESKKEPASESTSAEAKSETKTESKTPAAATSTGSKATD